MWIYLYFLTTALHYMNGLSIVGVTNDYIAEKNYIQINFPMENSDPWKFITVFNCSSKYKNIKAFESQRTWQYISPNYLEDIKSTLYDYCYEIYN
jgi:hypothetical protein